MSLLVEESVSVVSGVRRVSGGGVGGHGGVGGRVESAPVETRVGVGGGDELGGGHSDQGEDENGLKRQR